MARRWNPLEEREDRRRNIHEHREELPKEDLLFQINRWENESITKIRQAAETARRQLKKLLGETEARTSTMVNRLNEQLCEFQPQGFCEDEELIHCEEPSFAHRKELGKPLHIDIVSDNDRPPIYLIKLNVMKEDVVIIQSQRTPRQLNDSFKDIDISSKKSFAAPLDFWNIQMGQLRFESESHLDPTKNDNLILLQISSPKESQLSESLHKLNGGRLSVLNETSALLTQLQQYQQSTIVIDMFNKSLEDQDKLLNEISQLKHIHSLYIRGTPPEDDDARQNFFSKYPFIRAMFENEQSLIAQWAMDTANEYKKIGDMYIRKGEKEKAQLRFSQGVALYKSLSEFLSGKRHLK